MINTQEATLLQQGLTELNICLSEQTQHNMLAYLQLMQKWNKVYNLTAVTELKSMVIKHLLDSVSVAQYIHGDKVLDVGTGAGLPGVPLAMMLSDKHFTLLDAAQKRIRFLTEVKAKCWVQNIELIHARIEEFEHTPFSCIISRAFSQINDMLNAVAHLCDQDTEVLAMKGHYPEQELADIPNTWQVIEVKSLNINQLSAKRHLVRLKLA